MDRIGRNAESLFHHVCEWISKKTTEGLFPYSHSCVLGWFLAIYIYIHIHTYIYIYVYIYIYIHIYIYTHIYIYIYMYIYIHTHTHIYIYIWYWYCVCFSYQQEFFNRQRWNSVLRFPGRDLIHGGSSSIWACVNRFFLISHPNDDNPLENPWENRVYSIFRHKHIIPNIIPHLILLEEQINQLDCFCWRLLFNRWNFLTHVRFNSDKWYLGDRSTLLSGFRWTGGGTMYELSTNVGKRQWLVSLGVYLHLFWTVYIMGIEWTHESIINNIWMNDFAQTWGISPNW